MAESFSRQKSRHAPQKEGGLKKKKILCDLSSCVTPAGTSNELDVQNGWEENTTHTHRLPPTKFTTQSKFQEIGRSFTLYATISQNQNLVNADTDDVRIIR